jgi:aspartate aminotransferase-like enzyme
MFSEKDYESNTVSTIQNSFDVDITKVVNEMLERGFRLVNGYGNLKNKTFRIGHMGEMTLNELKAMLKVLTDVFSEMRIKN